MQVKSLDLKEQMITKLNEFVKENSENVNLIKEWETNLRSELDLCRSSLKSVTEEY